MRVTLLDPNWDQSAHLAAHLSSAGIEVTLVSSRPADRFGLGLYCKQVIPPHGVSDTAFLQDLLKNSKADLVLPLGEDLMDIIWKMPAELTTRIYPQTSAEQRAALTDRRNMYELVTAAGVPTPRLVSIEGPDALEQVISELGLPLVLRGTQGLAGEQVRVVHTREEAVESYRMLQGRSPEPPFAQAYVSGRRCLFGGLFENGRMLQWFSQQTIESLSPTGPSLRVQSLKDPVLTSYAEKIFASLRWTGLACAEFIKSDAGDGYYFLEVNPRPWAAIQAAHYCGVPLMRSFARRLLGHEQISQPDFANGKQVTLFPQFIVARMRTRAKKAGDWRAYLQAVRGAPWRHPGLLAYFLRRIWWTYGT